MATGPAFATSVCPADLVFLFGNSSAEKYREVHNFGETACNLKWAVSPSPQQQQLGGEEEDPAQWNRAVSRRAALDRS